MDLSYVALKRVKVGGKYRQPGDPVPEAAGWRNKAAYISTGIISPVPADSAVPQGSAGSGEGEESPSLADLKINEIKEKVESGEVSVEDAYLVETSDDGQNRTTLISWLEDRLESSESDNDDNEDADEKE